jgi:hypothetical protein
MHPGRDEFPDLTIAYPAGNLLQARMKTELKADQRLPAAARQCSLQRRNPVERFGNGFFEEQVATGLCRRKGDVHVQGSRVGHQHCVRVVSEGCSQLSFHREISYFIIRQSGMPGSIQHKVPFTQRQQIAQVTASGRAKTGDQEFHAHLSANARIR